MRVDTHTARRLAGAVALGRIALGIVALTAPSLPLRPWVGDQGRTPAARLLARALGGRDVALGLGAAEALQRRAPARGWVLAGGLADLGDAAATVGYWRRLPAVGRLLVLVAAGGGAAVAALAASSVDGP